MDVKEFKEIEFSNRSAGSEIRETSLTRQRRIGSLTNSIACRTPEAVKLDVDGNSRTKKTNDARNKANSIISTINLVQEATAEIGRLVKSIDGIAEQVESGDVSQERREILEAEANDLAAEIKRKAQDSSKSIRPLPADEIRAEIEEKLGRTLDDIIPAEDGSTFEIGEIKLDMRENIVNVRTSVARAQQRIETLQRTVTKAATQVKEIIDAHDVAAQNSEASQVSIRELDDALNLALETGSRISHSPLEALQSAGSLESTSITTLIDVENT